MAHKLGFETEVQPKTIEIVARSVNHTLAYFDRNDGEQVILYVHGLGASKSDFAEMCGRSELEGYRLVAYDQPGCNESPASVDSPDSIDVLVEILEGFVSTLCLKRFLLVAGSLGGLVGLLFAERHPDLIIGFVNVEGNLSSEDCMFSRKVVSHSFSAFEAKVFPEIKAALAARSGRGFSKHLKVLEAADCRAYYAYSFQTVAYSDGAGLLERFLKLPVPIFFYYGSANRGLSYLSAIQESHCVTVEFEGADHFLFYDAPKEYASALRNSVSQCCSLSS